MANEAVIIEFPKRTLNRTISDAVAVTKGQIMILSDPNTASGSTATHTGKTFAGIAAADKVASDGSTTLGCHMDGIFDLTCNAGVAISNGAAVAISGANLIRAAVEADFPTGAVIGYAEEAGSVNEVIRVRLGY